MKTVHRKTSILADFVDHMGPGHTMTVIEGDHPEAEGGVDHCVVCSCRGTVLAMQYNKELDTPVLALNAGEMLFKACKEVLTNPRRQEEAHAVPYWILDILRPAVEDAQA
jgi:hypothetical protein